MKEENRLSGWHGKGGGSLINFRSALCTCVGTLLVLSLGLVLLQDHASRHYAAPAKHARHLVNHIVYHGAFREAEALEPLGTNALPSLIEALRLKDSVTRDAYVNVRAKLPLSVRRWLPDILSTDKVRANAAALAGMLGSVAVPAIPDLIRLLEDDTADGNAAISLSLMGREAEIAIPALTTAVREHRCYAATTLGKMGAAAESALPVLQAAAQTNTGVLHLEAERAARLIAQR